MKFYESDATANTSFGSVPRAAATLFWAMFTLVEPAELDTQHWIYDGAAKVFFGVYLVIVIILFINLLIAMMNSTSVPPKPGFTFPGLPRRMFDGA